MNPTLRMAFHQHLVAALNAIAADADARMVADPANCRAIRLDAESARAALRRDLQPDPAWSADQREAFEAWRRSHRPCDGSEPGACPGFLLAGALPIGRESLALLQPDRD